MQLALVGAILLLTGCAEWRSSFPLEEEVRGKLRRGMTAEQVLATFGEPPGHQWVDVRLGGKVHYIAPPATRIKPGEGYAGFTVYFNQGKVWDWEVILLNPSYEHRLLPPKRRRWVVVAALVVFAAIGLGVFRHVRRSRSEREAITEAYRARTIPTAELPPDFRFITHEATLQSVVDRAGPYSRLTSVPSGAKASGETSITAHEYELSDRGAIIVMAEPPFQPESRVRAVFYRRPRRERLL